MKYLPISFRISVKNVQSQQSSHSKGSSSPNYTQQEHDNDTQKYWNKSNPRIVIFVRWSPTWSFGNWWVEARQVHQSISCQEKVWGNDTDSVEFGGHGKSHCNEKDQNVASVWIIVGSVSVSKEVNSRIDFVLADSLRQFQISAHCEFFRIFLSLRFYVKSILENLEVLKLPFLLFLGLWILLIC